MFWMIAAVLAADLTCSDVKGMVAARMTEEQILTAIKGQTIYTSDLECAKAANLAAPILEELGRNVRPDPAPVIPQPEPEQGAVPVIPQSPIPQYFRPEAPQPGRSGAMAVALSGSIGFGAGHFYACDPVGGGAFFALTLLPIGLISGGALWTADIVSNHPSNATTALQSASALSAVGWVLLGLVHAGDTISAVNAAERAPADCRRR